MYTLKREMSTEVNRTDVLCPIKYEGVGIDRVGFVK